MGFGVYSALSASLNINGSLGFNMHNAIVEVSGTISPIAQKDSSGACFTPTSKEIKRTAMGGETQTIANMDIGDLYFYAKEDMVFDFSFKNIGTLPITMTITIDLGENADKISIAEHIDYIPFSDNTYENFILADDTKHIKFALKLNDTANEIGKNAFSINFSFVESGVALTNGYYEGIQYTLDNTIPIVATNFLEKTSFLSTKATPLSNKTIYTATVSGYDSATIAADSKIQPFITDGENLYMVKSITDSAFADCTNITSVTMPDSVTSIESKAFAGSTGLTSITIGSNVASIGAGAFVDSSTSWIASPLNINKVNISSLEAWCNIDFTDANANPLSNELYLNNVKITDIRIPDGMTSIGQYAFNNFKGLTSITIPDSITSIGLAAFNNCTSLEYNYDTENDPNKMLKYLGNENNKYVYLSGVTDTSLTTATINSNTKFIGSDAFYNCSKLTSVTIPNSVTSIGSSVFKGCKSLTSITIPNSVTSIGASAFGEIQGSGYEVTLNINEVHITSLEAWCNIKFGSNDANPLYWGANLYLNGVKITDLIISDSVTSIGDNAFHNCSGLTSVNIPESVKSIGTYAFYNCTGLTSVTFESITPPTFVKPMLGSNGTFDGSGLKTIYVPNETAVRAYSADYYLSTLTGVEFKVKQ